MPFKPHGHWEMLHGNVKRVEDEADDDSKVEERVRDEGVEPLFEPPPAATTVPLQEEAGEDGPTWRTRPLVLLKL